MSDTPKNLIITGFMGTGKSTVGQLVAGRLGRDFIDMDELIETREGRSIPAIFAERGEPYFRQVEAELCRELAGQRNLVIATGGGTLVPETNLQVIARTGLVICLDCEPAVLWQRIGQSDNRPMLAGADEGRWLRLASLLDQRQPAYARIEQHIDVTYLSPEAVAERICDIVRSDE